MADIAKREGAKARSIAIVLALPVVAGSLIALQPDAASILAAGCLAALAVTVVPRLLGLTSRPIVYMQVVLILNVVIGVAVASSPTLTRYLGPDANYYHEVATDLSRHLQGVGPAPELPVGKEGFVYMVAVLYTLGGPTRYAVVLLNGAFIAATVGVTWWTTARLYGQRVFTQKWRTPCE